MPWKYTERVLNLESGSGTGKKYLGKTSPKETTFMLKLSGVSQVRGEIVGKAHSEKKCSDLNGGTKIYST